MGYNPSAVLSSEAFEEEVWNIAQVHWESELFDHTPLVNAEGDVREKLEFWKRIGTSKFIVIVIERGYILKL